MSLQSLKEQARQLSVSERLELVSAIIESLQDGSSQLPERSPKAGTVPSRIIKQMKGLLKTDQPGPTDDQVKAMPEERRVEKYL